MKKTTSFVAVYPLVLGMTLLETGAALGQPGVGPDITWVEKYVTYAQDSNGDLRLTDVHFLSEVVFDVFDDMKDVTARLYAGDLLVATYDPSSDKSAFTNGFFYTRKTRSFDSLVDLDGTWPPDTRFRWEIQYPDRVEVLQEIRIGGPEERTQVPRPSPITLAQGTAAIEPGEAIDSARPLTMSWLPFEEGAPLGDSPWSDFIFVLISDCHGEVVFTGGAPDTDTYVTFEDTSVEVPAGTLAPGRDYTFFISVVNTVDYNVQGDIEQLAANSYATELQGSTAGPRDVDSCPEPYRPAVYEWTRKTQPPGEMESWPTLKDAW